MTIDLVAYSVCRNKTNNVPYLGLIVFELQHVPFDFRLVSQNVSSSPPSSVCLLLRHFLRNHDSLTWSNLCFLADTEFDYEFEFFPKASRSKGDLPKTDTRLQIVERKARKGYVNALRNSLHVQLEANKSVMSLGGGKERKFQRSTGGRSPRFEGSSTKQTKKRVRVMESDFMTLGKPSFSWVFDLVSHSLDVCGWPTKGRSSNKRPVHATTKKPS